MKIKLLKEGYKEEEGFYQAFLDGSMAEYIDEENEADIQNCPDFPIYLGKKTMEERRESFFELVHTLERDFLQLDREFLMDELFWHSYLCIYKREYLLETYPELLTEEKAFQNIVIKDFDWENYIYKAVLAVQYVHDEEETAEDSDKYYSLILDNFDLFNYMIKYDIFRNSSFVIHILQIIEETGTCSLLKSKIKNRPDLGVDERYGRRVIYEFNKSYPVIMAPMLEKDQLKEYFERFLGYYL